MFVYFFQVSSSIKNHESVVIHTPKTKILLKIMRFSITINWQGLIIYYYIHTHTYINIYAIYYLNNVLITKLKCKGNIVVFFIFFFTYYLYYFIFFCLLIIFYTDSPLIWLKTSFGMFFIPVFSFFLVFFMLGHFLYRMVI